MGKLSFMFLSFVTALSLLSDVAYGATAKASGSAKYPAHTRLDELNPFAADIEEQLERLDREYENDTKKDSTLFKTGIFEFFARDCFHQSCAVWAYVDKRQQRMFVTLNGALWQTWLVSTGDANHTTPNFETHPDGRIYDAYTSDKYPGGDYMGLGNMPYAVFISGGFAIHGTGRSNWKRLGRPVSHGCVRLHPDNARTFNQLVRAYGRRNVWITVQ